MTTNENFQVYLDEMLRLFNAGKPLNATLQLAYYIEKYYKEEDQPPRLQEPIKEIQGYLERGQGDEAAPNMMGLFIMEVLVEYLTDADLDQFDKMDKLIDIEGSEEAVLARQKQDRKLLDI